MGEVYLAKDESLERNVALKILPPDLVSNEERLRRFVLEARSASSLNHPNIVTIYEIGQDRIRSSGAPDGADVGVPLHFISMELVNGATVGVKIHDEKADLKSLLGWLAQAAEGIAKAHAAGIVHRDLKPGNVMVTRDGFAKVLDFGLAKLAETRGDSGIADAPTVAQPATGAGVVLGTVGYMSPEQVQGRDVDARSDVFSFGCILYEAATRRRPFDADSNVETMHRILHDKPEPIESLNAKAPAELRRLVRRCMAKDPDQRIQSMKDVAIELREIVDEYETLAAASSGSGTAVAAPAGRRVPPLVRVAGLAIVLALAAWLALRMFGRLGTGPRGFEQPNVTLLTSRGDVLDPVLSPDGRYLAFTSGEPSARAIWVRQVSTGSDVRVLAPQNPAPFGLTFSPNGDYLYFQRNDPDRPGRKALYQIPTLGGPPVKRVDDIDTPPGISPDGRTVCFGRGVPERSEFDLVIRPLEGGDERVLAKLREPWGYNGRPQWSRRGDRIAALEILRTGPGVTRVAILHVRDGRRDTLATPPAPYVESLAWSGDDRSLVLAGIDLSGVPALQILLTDVPSGVTRRLTNGLDQYSNVSTSAAGDVIAVARETIVLNAWIADLSGGLQPLTNATSSEHSLQSLDVTGEGTIVAVAPNDRDIALFAIPSTGGTPSLLTPGGGIVFNFRTWNAGAFYTVGAGGVAAAPIHVWGVSSAGGDAHALTNGEGEQLIGVSPDGRTVYYRTTADRKRLLAIPAAGGPSRTVFASVDNVGLISPDGASMIVQTYLSEPGASRFVWRAGNLASGVISTSPVTPARGSDPRWTADSRSVSYLNLQDTTANVWRRPLDGGPDVQVTHFRDGRVVDYAWSHDGKWLAARRVHGNVSDLWLVPAGGGEAKPLTNFHTGTIVSMRWMPDDRHVVFLYGTDLIDGALIRNGR